MICVYVGTDPTQRPAELALECSIRKHTTGKVDLRFMRAGEPPFTDWKGSNTWGTQFTCFRFAVPALAGGGKAIYLDSDMLALGDLAELWAMPTEGWRCLVHNTAVGLLDCDRILEAVPELRDLDAMRASGRSISDYQGLLNVGGVLQHDLPREWHCLEGRGYVEGETKLLHLTAIPTQPWHPGARRHAKQWVTDLWQQYHDEATT